jgi:hypothetical protein
VPLHILFAENSGISLAQPRNMLAPQFFVRSPQIPCSPEDNHGQYIIEENLTNPSASQEKIDALIKSPKSPFSVIPAKAGIQFIH